MTRTKQKGTLTNVGLAGGAGDVVSRYGSGVKEHVVSYEGIDNETGRVLKRSLKSIAKSKRGEPGSEFYKQNTKQQAGFSAEVKEVARQRAKQAINGKIPTTTRTDDIPGHVNDPLFDITTKVDRNSNPIPDSSAQVKFVGSSPEAAVEKMMGKDYQKYIDNDVKMVVPSDYYDKMKSDLQKRTKSLEKQIERIKGNGPSKALTGKQEQLEKCRTLEKNLQKSNTSNAEAIEARNHPWKSTAKDVLRTANRAGLDQAKMGAAIGGGMSLVQNLIAVCRGEKTKKDAAIAIVGDTTSAAGLSYATAFAGATIKGMAQNSSRAIIRGVSKTNLPAYIVTSTLEAGKTLKAYFSGEINGVECLEELGEKGSGIIASAMFATLGQIVIPVPVVGALVGGMIGYALSSASYNILLSSLKGAKLAHDERLRIERECAQAVELIRECRADLEENIKHYLSEKQMFFNETFAQMKTALELGDIDGYISATNDITESFGKKPLYRSRKEFDQLMSNDDPVII